MNGLLTSLLQIVIFILMIYSGCAKSGVVDHLYPEQIDHP